MKGGRRNNGVLQPLPIPDRPWQEVSMDLITGLPLTANGFDAIFTFVDRLSKSVHLCPASATIDAAGAANLYIQNVFRLHGLSRSIVCDRDPRFTAEFFKEVFSRLGSKLKFSTANHPQTDGQSERANRVVGDILRSFVNHRQNNWDDCLPFCEFAINDMLQESTKETPFRIVYGWHPTSPADMLNLPQGSVAQPWLECQQEALVIARDCILAAQARQALYADQHRHGEDFRAAEKVLVHRDFLSTDVTRAQPCEKLKPVWVGPFEITRMLSSNAARLELPRNCRAHPVFNVSALRKYHANDIPGRVQPPPPPVTDLDGHQRYCVGKVLDCRERRGKTQYLVKWIGYREPTWEPAQRFSRHPFVCAVCHSKPRVL